MTKGGKDGNSEVEDDLDDLGNEKSGEKTPKKAKTPKLIRTRKQRAENKSVDDLCLGLGIGLGGARKKTISAIGRGRAGSLQCSPVVGAIGGVEPGLSLADIPLRVGPAVVNRGLNLKDFQPSRYRDALSSEEEDADDQELPQYDREVERLIALEEKKKQRLVREKKLTKLKRENLQLQHEIDCVQSEFEKETARVSHSRDTFVSESFRQPTRNEAHVGSRRLAEVSSARELPTLHDTQSQIPSVHYLRSRQDLRTAVDEEISNQNLWELPDRTTGNQGTSSGVNPSSSGSLISGRVAKTESGIQKPVVWPHTRLEGRQSNPSFDKLTFPLLILGELGIFQDPQIDSEEKVCRVKQLKRVCNYAHRNIDFDNIREYHGAFLAAAERAGTWDIDTSELASQYLYVNNNNYSSRSQGRSGKNQTNYSQKDNLPDPPPISGSIRHFCGFYQEKKCEHKTTHKGLISGEVKWCEHICATCWSDYHEAVGHPEITCTRPPLRWRRRYVGKLPVASGMPPPLNQQ